MGRGRSITAYTERLAGKWWPHWFIPPTRHGVLSDTAQ